MDDGSTDRTVSIAQQYAARDARVRVIRQSHAGVANARNRAYDASRGDFPYLILLDQDDELEKDALAHLTSILGQQPNAVGAHGKLRYIDPCGRPISVIGESVWPRRRLGIRGWRLVESSECDPTTFAILAYSVTIPAGSMMFRREAVQAIGCFDPAAVPADDWDLWLRLSTRGDIAFVNRVVFAWRHHAANTSRNRHLMYAGFLYVRRKMLRSATLTPEQLRTIRWGYRYYELRACVQLLEQGRRSLSRGRLSDSWRASQEAATHAIRALRGDL